MEESKVTKRKMPVSPGRPKGSQNRITTMAKKFLQAHEQEILDAWLEAATAGDGAALRLAVERLFPVRKEAPLPPLALPEVKTLGDVPGAMGALLDASAQGLLTPSELSAFTGAVTAVGKAIEGADVEARLRALELRMEGKG